MSLKTTGEFLNPEDRVGIKRGVCVHWGDRDRKVYHC